MSKQNQKFVEEIKKARGIKENVKILLFARSAGRCELCNELLIKDKITSQAVLWGEMAHIYAFNLGGSRSDEKNLYKNDVENLILACPNCHEKIDKNGQDKFYSIEYLKNAKVNHEKKIRLVTAPKQDGETKVLSMVANINNEVCKLSMFDIVEALMRKGLYSCEENIEEIDFTSTLALNNGLYWNSKKEEIDQIISKFYSDLRRNKIKHVSIFAIGPMPLLMYLGSKIDNKIKTSVFQRHRDGEGWCWNKSKSIAEYEFRLIKEGGDKTKVAFLLSLSGFVNQELLPDKIRQNYYIYELFVSPNPNYNFLRSEIDLFNFEKNYSTAISTIKNNHGNLKQICVFPAAPAPVAVVCGRSLNKNSDPKLRIFNTYNKGKFKYILTIN
ncbi:MAG: HNH endonuclease [Clostridia bacterium]|nr:HNH endonuclease [Clostridia bacterium]